MEFQTTFWQDITIAEAFGNDAIIDTFNIVFDEWKTNHIYLTEMVIVLNWKIWQHYENKDQEKAKLYNKLWRQADEYATNNLKGDELDYFFKTAN